MTDSEILDVIAREMRRIAPKEARAVAGANLDHLSLSALGLDSIGMMELISAIESATGVTFADHELVGVDRVAGLVRLIQVKQDARP